MTDPLDALREPSRRADPDPAFAARLRARLEAAVLAAPTPTTENPMATSTTSTRPAAGPALTLHTITPYLIVPAAAEALDFYVDAFGAVRRGDPIVMPDGRVGHAEIALGDSVLMLAEEFPELGLVAPEGTTTLSLRLETADPDGVVARAVARGARLERAVTDSPYGRGGTVVDPAGHRWMVSHEAAAGAPLQAGDVGYASLWRPDVDAAQRFYAAVLGWTVEGDPAGYARRVTGLEQHLGMYVDERSTMMCCYAVDDVDETITVVRAAGGTAEEPLDEAWGRTATCADDQGLPFAVFAPLPGGTRPDTSGPGALTYLTIEVPDAGRARAFYGTVLGWRFRPGRTPGGWAVQGPGGDTSPATGLRGGAARAAAVPMFVVADVAAAVATVRARGGQADDPAFAGYGTSARCTDDQGGAFWVVQY